MYSSISGLGPAILTQAKILLNSVRIFLELGAETQFLTLLGICLK